MNQKSKVPVMTLGRTGKMLTVLCILCISELAIVLFIITTEADKERVWRRDIENRINKLDDKETV
jgi:hypothetical protein